MKSKKSKTYTVKFRRKRQGKTDYKKRFTLLKSKDNRLVIRKSIKNITVQIVGYDKKGDKVVLSAHSNELKKYGYKLHGGNIMAAYLVGLLAGKKAKSAKISRAVADIGLYPSTKGSRLYAAVKGAIDSGLEVPSSEDNLPPEDRINGKHVEIYAKKLSENKEAYEKQFSEYLKNKVNPAEISKHLEDVKNKILKGGN